MKKIILMLLLMTLIISGCTMPCDNASYLEANGQGDFTSAYDLYLDAELKDGEFYEIPGLNKEEIEAYQDSEAYLELLRARLEGYGVFLTPGRYPYIFSEAAYSHCPITISRYQDFDFLFLSFPGYRGTPTGNLYVFENSLFKGRIINAGNINFEDCFRSIGEKTYFITTKHYGGSGLGLEHKQWIDLTDDRLQTVLVYTNYYATSNFSLKKDLDFDLMMTYMATEKECSINQNGVPTVTVEWEKTVYDNDKVVVLITSGVENYSLSPPSNWDYYGIYEPNEENLMAGLEEQLNDFAHHGTDEEKHIARQMIDHFLFK